MLKLCRRGSVEDARDLSAAEDQMLRRAFGRFATPEHRAAGAAVVRAWQHRGNGCWFLCDCLGDVGRPPALVPVAETHIRRHQDQPGRLCRPSLRGIGPAARWPQHADGCDFARDPAEQRQLTRSYARSLEVNGPRLVRRLADADRITGPVAVQGRSYGRGREALATLLMQLLEAAGIDRIAPDGAVAAIAEQFKALRAAARAVEIDAGVLLSDYLCTYAPALPELLRKVATAPAARFRHTRPHGVLLCVVAGMAQGSLALARGERLAVRGRIAVFAEGDGHGRDTLADRDVRSPYLAACLVGRPAAAEPPMILKAYCHPIAGSRHLLPVDSNLERSTLAQLLRLQQWLRRKCCVQLTITKPLFDIAQPDPEAPRDPCIPDFVLHASGVGPRGCSVVIAETMGYADLEYRARKARTHRLMAAALGGAPVVTHDFHAPAAASQAARDRLFWSAARWAVTGPEGARPATAAPGTAHPPPRPAAPSPAVPVPAVQGTAFKP